MGRGCSLSKAGALSRGLGFAGMREQAAESPALSSMDTAEVTMADPVDHPHAALADPGFDLVTINDGGR